jgi:hypothetical protein
MISISRHAAPWLPAAANALGFNLVWLATVLGAAAGLPWAGPAACAAFASAQLAVAARPRYDLAAMAVFASAGLAIDSAWSLSGAVRYSAAWPSAALAPVWLVSLWVAFALTLDHSLAWLRRRPLLAAQFGGFGGGWSYWAGARLGAVETMLPPWAYGVAVGACWAVSLPLLIRLTALLAARRRLPAYQR